MPNKPFWLYHVTPFADQIMRTGFIARTKHNLGRILGGAGDEAVSFTDNLDLAKGYKEGLDVYLGALQGRYNIDDYEQMMNVAQKFGVSRNDAKKAYEFAQQGLYLAHIDSSWDKETQDKINKFNQEKLDSSAQRRMHTYLTQLAIAGFRPRGALRMPLVMGGFPERLKDSDEISILKISTTPGHGKIGPQKINHNPGEHEWRIADPENFDYTTLEKI